MVTKAVRLKNCDAGQRRMKQMQHKEKHFLVAAGKPWTR
jgi:hypothetical protein